MYNTIVYRMIARGSRAQVMHGSAKRTSGGLQKKDLKYNKQGKIVSKKMSARAKKEKRLVKAGYKTKKGTFGSFKNGKRVSKRRSRRKSKRRSRRRQRGGVEASKAEEGKRTTAEKAMDESKRRGRIDRQRASAWRKLQLSASSRLSPTKYKAAREQEDKDGAAWIQLEWEEQEQDRKWEEKQKAERYWAAKEDAKIYRKEIQRLRARSGGCTNPERALAERKAGMADWEDACR